MRRFGAIASSEQSEQTVWKTADETVNNSATYQDDDTLIVALASGALYKYVFQFFWSTDGTADFKFQLAYTGTSDAIYCVTEYVYPDGTTMVIEQVKTSFTGWGANGSTGTHGFGRVSGIINTTGAGNLKLQWAQQTQTAVDTKVLKGSSLTVIKVV